MYYIYLDDERTPKTKCDWNIARTYEDFVDLIDAWVYHMEAEEADWGLYISFDHDIADHDENGNELSGLSCMKYLVNFLMNKNYSEDFCKKAITINVHSANPIGKANIEMFWKAFLRSF